MTYFCLGGELGSVDASRHIFSSFRDVSSVQLLRYPTLLVWVKSMYFKIASHWYASKPIVARKLDRK